MRSLRTLAVTTAAVTLTLSAGLSVASAQPSPPAGGMPNVTDQLEQMRAAMPPDMQRMHDQMMTGDGAAGMQQMMGRGAMMGKSGPTRR